MVFDVPDIPKSHDKELIPHPVITIDPLILSIE